MDNGEMDLSNQETSLLRYIDDLPSSGSMDSFMIDELLLKDATTHTCTHIHTCTNPPPPGRDNHHTHTCFHVHPQIMSAPPDDDSASAESVKKKTKERALGNRESVRKYREKKKARSVSLEDEAVRLEAVNQQLLKRLQGQAALEAEVSRLKCLLVDIRGRIEGEIGCFPYRKSVSSADMLNAFDSPCLPAGSYRVNPCNVVECSHRSAADGKNEQVLFDGHGFSGTGFETLNCFADMGTGSKEFHDCGAGNLAPTTSMSKGPNDEATTG